MAKMPSATKITIKGLSEEVIYNGTHPLLAVAILAQIEKHLNLEVSGKESFPYELLEEIRKEAMPSGAYHYPTKPCGNYGGINFFFM